MIFTDFFLFGHCFQQNGALALLTTSFVVACVTEMAVRMLRGVRSFLAVRLPAPSARSVKGMLIMLDEVGR